MPWYAWLYLTVLTGIIIAAAFDDLRDADPFPVVVVDLLEGCVYWIAVVFWYRPYVPTWLAAILPLLLLGAAAWTTRRAKQVLGRLAAAETELTEQEARRAIRLAGAMGAILLAPAYIAGVRLAWRLLAG